MAKFTTLAASAPHVWAYKAAADKAVQSHSHCVQSRRDEVGTAPRCGDLSTGKSFFYLLLTKY